MAKLGTADSPPQNAASNSAATKIAPAKPSAPQSWSDWIQNSANNLHADGSSYAGYGLIDTGTLGTAMVGYGFNVTHTMESSDIASTAMYDWLRTPEGIIAASLGIIPLALYSAFANTFFGSDTAAGKALYRSWQAFRDSVKGLKNAFTGTKSGLTAIRLLATQDYTYLLMPLALIFGVLSMGNRAWNRSMVNKRKDMQDELKKVLRAGLDEWGSFRQLSELPSSNTDLKKHANGFRLIKNDEDPTQKGLYYISYDYDTEKATLHRLNVNERQIKAFLAELNDFDHTNILRPSILQWRHLLPGIAEKHYAEFLQAIRTRAQKNKQTKTTERLAYASQTYAGFIDGLYMFMGLIVLTSMSPSVLIAVSCVSIFFSAVCILTRLHEEKDFQNNLFIEQQKTELALSAKEVEIQLAKLNEIQWKKIYFEERFSKEARGTLPTYSENQEKIHLGELQRKADKALNEALAHFNATRDKLHDAHKISTLDIIMVGLRHALAAYTALVTAVFTVSLVSQILFATALPEIVALCTITAGIALCIGSMLYALSVANTHEAKRNQLREHSDESVYQFIEHHKNKPQATLFQEFPKENTKQKSPSLLELGIDFALPAYVLLSWTDIVRATFSGARKAFKLAVFMLSLVANPEFASSDNSLLWGLAIPGAIVFALVFAFRSLAKYSKSLFETSSDTSVSKQFSLSDQNKASPSRKPTEGVGATSDKAYKEVEHEETKKEQGSAPSGETPTQPPQKRRASGSALKFFGTQPKPPGADDEMRTRKKSRAQSEGDNSDDSLQNDLKSALDKLGLIPTTPSTPVPSY